MNGQKMQQNEKMKAGRQAGILIIGSVEAETVFLPE